MKSSELTSAFTFAATHERSEWLSAPASYTNRHLVHRAYDDVRPGWSGLTTALPHPPADLRLPENTVQGLLVDDIPVFLRHLLHEGV